MQVLLNETDITGMYDFQTVIAKDTDGEEQDVCELRCSKIIQADVDDVMVLSGQGYNTGRQYVNGLSYNGSDYSVYARGISEKGREAKWASFENVTLMELMYLAAKDLGMGYQRYGVEDQRYARIIRRDENWPEFLRRLLKLESAVLKCVDGKLTAISILWAQSQKAVRTYNITESTPGCRYYEPFSQYHFCILQGEEIDGKAVDTAVPGGREWEPRGIVPGNEKGQARRWAQGELLNKNRMGRCFEMAMPYDPELAAMSRIDLAGMSVTRGSWIAGKVLHDMKNEKTNVLLRPCITTIQ